MNKKTLDGDDIRSLDMFQSIETTLIDLIAYTSIWVSPDKISLEPVYPNVKRGRSNEKGKIINGLRIDDNTYANVAIKKAISNNIEFKNYMACHIWPGTTYDERYHTLLANLVLIPRILANLSDYFSEVIDVLKYRSYELYGWHPDGTGIPQRPPYYPRTWNKFITEQDALAGLENSASSENYLKQKEIDKVKKRVPRWIDNPNQINSKILKLYMSLSENDSFPVSYSDLKEKYELSYGDVFNSNYNQMKNFGTKNHAKVFSEAKDGMISLWGPVADYIRDLFA